MKKIIKFNIASILAILLILNHVTFLFAQTATLLPNGMQQFFDNNGNPLTSGTVDFYIPSTFTRKNTWQDTGETIVNTNPVVLDAAGRALIYGDGVYRQILKDQSGNLIWDRQVSSFATASTIITTGDGDVVGTIKPFAGINAPSQYQFAAGQEISRATFSALFTAVTLVSTVNCSNGSPVVTGVSNITSIPIGGNVELTCVPAGTTVVSKTGTSVTLNNPSNVSLSASATFFMYGNGNGSTTFNLPDLRGYVIAANDNMNGAIKGVLTSTFFGTNPDAIGAKGGGQSVTLVSGNLPPYTPTGTINISDPGHTHGLPGGGSFAQVGGTGSSTALFGASGGITNTNTASSTTGLNSGNVTFAGVAQGGTSTAFGIIQPTFTLNYIIKVTPDTSNQQASGVASLGGMIGAITCGTGLLCTGNTISSTISAGVSGPVSSTVGHLAIWNNTIGTLLADSTILPTITAPATFSPSSGTALTITPSGTGIGIGVTVPAGLATGIIINNPMPSGTASGFSLNSINCGLGTPDSIDAGGTPGNECLLIAHRVQGSKGGRASFAVQSVITGPPAVGDTLPQWIAGAFLSQGNANAGGSENALSATVGAGGSGYTNGAQVLTATGGTCTTQPTFNVTVAGNVVTTVNSVATAGACTARATNPVATTGGGGTGATLNITFGLSTLAQTQGAIFPINPIAKLVTSATGYSGSISECDIENQVGSSVWYSGCMSMVTSPLHKVRASYYDTMLSFSGQAGTVGSDSMILVSPANSAYPYTSTSTFLLFTNKAPSGSGTTAGNTIGNLIDATLVNINTCAFKIAFGCVIDGAGNVVGNAFNTAGTIITTNATASTTTTTGALKVTGGIGAQGAINGTITVSAWDSTVQVALRANSGGSVGQVGTISNHALQMIVNNAAVVSFVAGTQFGTPTGGDKGNGTGNFQSGIFANGTAGVSTTCTVTAGNTYVFTFGLLTTKGANCT